MKTSLIFSILGLIMSSVLSLTSCTQDEDMLQTDITSKVESLYNDMMQIPTSSMLSDYPNVSSRSYKYFPILTKSDLTYLQQLSQENFEKLIQNYKSKLGDNPDEVFDSLEYNSYSKTFEIMDGHSGMNRYLDFAQLYLNSEGGINEINKLLPKNLTETQLNYYVATAVYMDKIGRPFIQTLTETVSVPRSRDKDSCKWEAAFKLACAGLTCGVEVMIDLATGGASIPAEMLAGGANLVALASIWQQYEICNGRWH